MILLDSNLVIYLKSPILGRKILSQAQGIRLNTCNVIIAEVMGYKQIEKLDAEYFEKLLSSMKNRPFDIDVTKKAIEIRKSRSIALPDAIIAATAVVNNLVLWTHNMKDFENIPDLQVYDPLADLA